MLENRIPPPIIGVVFAAAMWGARGYAPVFEIPQRARELLVLALALLGLKVALAGVLAFKEAKTTVNPLEPERASSLVVVGIYRFSRNPMYLGMALWLSAWAVYLSSPWLLLGPLGFVLYMNRFQIRPEERAMETLFGDEFARYKQQVRPWI